MIGLLLGVATLAVDVRTIDTTPPDPPSATYPGAFDRPPVPQWEADLPGGRMNAMSHAERSRPVVHGGTILTGAAAGEALYVVSRADGRLLRTYPADGAVEAEPVIEGGTVYYADTAGTLWAVDLDSGEPLWSTPGEAPRPTTPVLDGDTIYVPDVADLVVARDKADGTLRWRYQRKADPSRLSELTLYAAPAVALSGDQVLVGFSDGSLAALDHETGDVLWDLRIGEGRYPDLVAPPLVEGGMVYASGYLTPLVALDLQTRTVRWRLDAGSAAAALLVDTAGGRLLMHPGTDGTLRAVDPVTGDVRWSWDSDSGAALTEPVLTEAGLVVASSGGDLALVDPDDGALLWRRQGERALLGLTAAPLVAGRQLLFTTNAGRIHAMISPRAPRLWRRPASDGFDVVDPGLRGWLRGDHRR